MRILKMLLRLIAVIVGTALLAVAVSTLAEREKGETIISIYGMRLTVTGIGGALSFLTIMLFAALRFRDHRRRNEKSSGVGEKLNAVGFGLLPGAAVWKVFEQLTTLSRGKEVYEPLTPLPFLTEAGFFAPSRIELICSILFFAAVIAWLMLRKRELPGNGDLIMTVICAWGMFRTVTEMLRTDPLIRAGSVNVTQILFFAAADLCFAIWTRRKERIQKSTAYAVLEWIAVLSCQTVVVLNTAGVLSAGSMIGNLAVCTGCAVLGTLLILLSGKDSRTGRIIAAGSGSSVYGS